MPLWLAIVLPALPLQLAARALATDAPLVVVEGPAQRLRVVFCNDAACRAGIAPGHKLAAAQALAGDLVAVERNAERERDALLELAGWAGQFSAAVSVRSDGLLLETGGSLRLFGGRARLNREIAAQLYGLGYRGAFGEAATPQAAWWLAQARARGAAVVAAAPAQAAAAPAHAAAAPMHATIAPAPAATAPLHGAIVPALAATTPAQAASAPMHAAIAPAHGAIVPAHAATAPAHVAQAATTPAHAATAPMHAVAAPAPEATMPSATAPETTAPPAPAQWPAVPLLAQLPAALVPLPLAALGWPADTVATLHALGLRTLGDLLRLPRDGVNRRFGTALLAEVDRALGHLPDPQPLFEPPQRFSATIELPADVVDCAQLMLPAQRLLRSLEGFLRGRGAGATELVFHARHSPRRAVARPPTEILLALAAPERDAARLAQLLAERLDRVRLPEPAVALALTVERLLPFAPASPSFLPPAPAQAGLDWLRLAETLHARLGSARVFQLQALDDHRPERAWRAVPIAIDAAERIAPAHARGGRPLLLLPQPQPLPGHDGSADELPRYRGALQLVAGPERIEAGWWDLASPAFGRPQGAVARDYFVARNPQGQTLWIYRDLAAPRGWFLHGLFA
jgi:protein ImuB